MDPPHNMQSFFNNPNKNFKKKKRKNLKNLEKDMKKGMKGGTPASSYM